MIPADVQAKAQAIVDTCPNYKAWLAKMKEVQAGWLTKRRPTPA